MNVRSRRLSPWLLLMLALQLAGAAIAAANQEWAILAALLATLLLAPALRKPLDELDEMADALRTSDDELSHRALHDPLTGLANRALLFDRIGHALERRGDAPIARPVHRPRRLQDVQRHASATAAATRCCSRSAGACGASLRPSDTVARLGGDEFAVLVEDLAEPHGATSVAERILLALSRPSTSAGAALEVSASIGVAVSGGDLSDADELVRAADLAMYAAKGAARRCYRSFEPSMLARHRRAPRARAPTCGARSRATRSSCTTSRWWTWRRPRCAASRRSRAGRTASAAASPPTSSSRWPSGAA